MSEVLNQNNEQPVQNPQVQQAQPKQQEQPVSEPQIDYDKLAQLVSGKQAATEESVLKGYLKNQGLTKEQMEQAISTYKQQQEANKPDVNAIQSQAQQAIALAQQKEVENAAILQAMKLGVDAKTIPYVLKMADFQSVRSEDGKVSEEALKKAVEQVLEDVPALKPQNPDTAGFHVGASGGTKQPNNEDALKKAFGI